MTCSRPSRRLLAPPSHLSSPSPYPYRVIGMVMISFVGVVTFDKPGTGATSILQALIWVSPKHQLRNATLAPCCSYYASSAAALADYTCTKFSDKCFSPHSSRGLSKSSVMPLSGAEGGELTATLALCMGVFGPIQPTNPVRGLYTEVIAQKA